MDRRKFLSSTACLIGASGGFSAMGLLAHHNARAQMVSDYKALVCVYLYGGNDGHNTLVPYESSAYAQYKVLRPEYNSSNQAGLGISRNALLPLSVVNASPVFGLHPALIRTHARWAQGQVAWIQNIGNLVEPLERSSYFFRKKPVALGGHLEQQDLSMLAAQDPQGPGTEAGWSSRMLLNARLRGLINSTDFSQISFGGINRLHSGQDFISEVLNPNEILALNYLNQITPLINQGVASFRPFTKAYAQQMEKAFRQGQQVNSVFSVHNTNGELAFQAAQEGAPQTYVSNQLLAIARFIEARQQLQVPGRQVFFVAAGGFDTHADQYILHSNLLADLDRSLHSFFSAMEALGLSQQVTAFTMSDFGRTLRANASHGTDHAWASHLMVMGGAVRGGLYGRAADITPSSEDIAPNDNNWVIPSTSINQYAATLAAWMGLSPTDLNAVFPDLRNFAQPNLGFMNS